MSEQKKLQPENDGAPKRAEQPQFNASGSKYLREIRCLSGGKADVYAILDGFDVRCPARQHAIKKLLCSGLRGKGDVMQDLHEARDAVDRAIQMESVRKSDNTINDAITQFFNTMREVLGVSDDALKAAEETSVKMKEVLGVSDEALQAAEETSPEPELSTQEPIVQESSAQQEQPEERLVVVPVASLPKALLTSPVASTELLWHGSHLTLREWVDQLFVEEGFVLDRSAAETDKRQRQLISYTVFTCMNLDDDEPKVLLYNRQKHGGEVRLNDKVSIGVGGHINEDDWKTWSSRKAEGQPEPLLTIASRREAIEELKFATQTAGNLLLEAISNYGWDEEPSSSLICSSASDVDSVHLGLVRIIQVPASVAQAVSLKDNPSDWVPIASLKDLPNLESWSRICLSTLEAYYLE
jgi:predicted NUDIX family phosphoesterase